MIKISKAALMHPLRKWKIPHVVYFDQLSGAACTRKLVETLFSAVFNFLNSFARFFNEIPPKIKKKKFKRSS